MEFQELLTTYGSQGIFFVLFLYVFKRQEMKTDARETKSEDREARLLDELKASQEINREATQLLKEYKDLISEDLKEIKETLNKGDR